MKTLYLLRHAKSSWDDPDLDDFDRPLNHRGKKDAPKMGKRLRKAGAAISFICSSPAARAITTARLAGEELSIPKNAIREERKLYHAGPDGILAIVQSFSEEIDTVMIVGHNPGLTEFADELLNEDLGNIPTAGIVGAKLNVATWKEVRWGSGKMEFYDYPKRED